MNSLRSQIYQTVSSMTPLDLLEQEHIHFVKNWIESGREIFRIEKPAIPDTHLVSYFVIVNHDRDQILLVDHIKAELWLPPGGHVEPGEDPKETVRREAKEELELEFEFLYDDPVFLTVTETVGNISKHTDVSLWYLLKGDPNQILNFDSNEFKQIRWFKIKDIPYERSDPQIKRFVLKILMKS